ncbi:uncharacterized protein HMPREF1541_05435 [Cyphellophora europaea CBS 101466]|uniref:Heterokaryon incompatibility domain-containing protein n=1 Tax=Cyphellophora europaea (strain CBS 101466) TaxID=1220924 RepID=W2RRX4_CYPE1|nr:uncharacterized protein HMPREF1541_05435 [Cyphellophora europaea CBS 101466]ETN39212.1 hypothetical protein HMPREF1541_05435 [Cyphellophora europaea CBS 101466]
MPPPTYEEIYQSLPVRDSQTRLLRLQPSKRYEDDLVCTLSVMDLDSEPVSADDYVALSYSWGDESRDHTVLCSGLSIKVTKSCFNALRALRQQGEQRIWIDQLCVDQTTIAERSNQVALMYKTFRQAQKTYVFLGLLPDLIAALHCDFLPRRMSPSQALRRLLDQDEGKTTGELLSMSLVTKTQMREMLRAASSELHGDSVSQLKALMEEAILWRNAQKFFSMDTASLLTHYVRCVGVTTVGAMR